MTTNSITAHSDRGAAMEGKVVNLLVYPHQRRRGCVRSRIDSPRSSMSDVLIYTPGESEEDMEEDSEKSTEFCLSSFLDLYKDETNGSESTSSLKRNDSDIAGNPDEVSCEYSDLSEEKMDDLNAIELLARANPPDSDGSARLNATTNSFFDSPINSVNDSEPNLRRLGIFRKRDAKSTSNAYHAYGKNDLSTPKTFNEAWRSKFWSPDGHRRVPTTSRMSADDCLERARIEHDMWTVSAQSTALELAELAQASYKEFLGGLEGYSHKSEAADDGVNLEGPLHPMFRDNVFESAIKDLLKATLKAREATETAEALALYPSHLINHLDDVDDIRECLHKIEEKYRRLRNVDATRGRTFSAPTVSAILNENIDQLTIPEAAANSFPQPAQKKTRRRKRGGAKRREMREATPDATSSEPARSEVKNEELAQQTKIEATQEPAKLIVKTLVMYSLLWSTMMLILPRYTTLPQTYTLVGVYVAKDLCDLYRNRSWFWNSEASVVVSKVLVIRRVVRSQAFNYVIACGHPPSTAVYIVGLVPFGINILRGRHFDWVVSRTLNRLFFAKHYDRTTAPVQGPFPQKLTDSPAFTRLGSFDLNPQRVLYNFLWNDLLKVACFVLLYITIFSHDSPASKGLALMTAIFIGSKGFSRLGIVEEGERVLSVINREYAFARSSGSVRCPLLKMSWTAIELCDLAIWLLLDVSMIMGSIV